MATKGYSLQDDEKTIIDIDIDIDIVVEKEKMNECMYVHVVVSLLSVDQSNQLINQIYFL